MSEAFLNNSNTKTTKNFYDVENNCDRKELQINLQKEITCYFYHSLPLCIILSENKLYDWFYLHYIQLVLTTAAHNDGNTGVFLDFLEGHNYDVWHNSNEVLKRIYVRDGFFIKNRINILDVVINGINNQHYLIVFLDEYYLPDKANYKKHHFMHESLIYGYDNEKKEILSIAFDKNNIFNKIRYSYSDFCQAFKAKLDYDLENEYGFSYANVTLYKINDLIKENIFSIKRFSYQLYKYLFSISDIIDRYYFDAIDGKFSTEARTYSFGFDIYDQVIKSLYYSIEKCTLLDYTIFHLLSEHKKGLYNRLQYILSKYPTTATFQNNVAKFYNIANEFEMIRLKCLKLNKLISLNSFRLDSDKYTEFINEVINRLEAAKNAEKAILLDIYEELMNMDDK